MVAISLYGIATQSFSVKEKTFFEKVLIETLAPIQEGTMSFKERLAKTIDHYLLIVETSKKNEELSSKIATLENQIFTLKEVQKENQRLKALLDFGKDIERKKVLAQVISWDSSNEFRVLRVNKGENHGLQLLAPVITMNGLVGYIYSLGKNYAEVLTILDQNNRVDAIVARSRSHGIVEGNTDFTCSMKYVNRTEELVLGDVIITAGLGEIYPKGIRIGTISNIDKKNYGITQKVEIKPSVDFQKLEEVVILVNEGKVERFSDDLMSLSVEEKNE